MSVTLTPHLVGTVVLITVVAGAINGVAGFGFAVVGTMALATILDPATAVVFMIAPILSVNISLVRDLSPAELQTCSRRFGPLIGAALVGTVIGMGILKRIPAAPLQVSLGVVALAFVASVQRLVPIPGLSRAKDGCFVETLPAMIGVGGISGLLFGGTNVGVQLIAYIRSCDLSHSVFIGVVAMVFLGLNGIRVVAATFLGLYPDLAIAAASIAAAVPAVAGVALGKQVRNSVRGTVRRGVVLGLLAVIGVRLVLSGSGIA